MEDNISVWEGEGGSFNDGPGSRMRGSVNQIKWAERLRGQVNGEFDRVSGALHAVALKQSERGRLVTFAIMLILEEKRGEVLANERAGYFIHDWQDLRDKVRKLIMDDPRYKTIKKSGN